MRHPSINDSLKRINSLGVPVSCVLDVGVQSCTLPLIESFNNVTHFLFEPISEWNDPIHKIYKAHNIEYELVNIAVSDYRGEVTLRLSSVEADKEITHARIDSAPSGNGSTRIVPANTLDNIVSERAVSIPKPYLLKIDVDGADTQVLKGATQVLNDCSVVIIEANHNNFLERAQIVERAGFKLFDIVDLCYYDNRLAQFDLVFLNKKIEEDMQIEIYRDGFDVQRWQVYLDKTN